MKRAILTSLLVAASVAHADTLVTNYASWDGSYAVSQFGVPNTQTYGQTFKTPNAMDTFLESWKFKLDNRSSTLPGSFRFYVAEWNVDRAAAAPIFTSAPLTIAANSGWTDFTVTGINKQLDASKTYVSYISTSAMAQTGQSGNIFQAMNINTLASGNFVFINNGSDTSQWTSTGWVTNLLGGDDTVFEAKFAVVPEPVSMIGLGLGLLAFARRKKSA